jgi:hypothetical protein
MVLISSRRTVISSFLDANVIVASDSSTTVPSNVWPSFNVTRMVSPSSSPIANDNVKDHAMDAITNKKPAPQADGVLE